MKKDNMMFTGISKPLMLLVIVFTINVIMIGGFAAAEIFSGFDEVCENSYIISSDGVVIAGPQDETTFDFLIFYSRMEEEQRQNVQKELQDGNTVIIPIP